MTLNSRPRKESARLNLFQKMCCQRKIILLLKLRIIKKSNYCFNSLLVLEKINVENQKEIIHQQTNTIT
jgi:hypothetical protein